MRARIRLEVVVGVVFAALLAAGPGIANGAAWLPPVPLNNAAASQPSVALDGPGNAIAAWQTDPASNIHVIQAAHHSFGAPGFPALTDFADDSNPPSPPPLANTSPVVALDGSGTGIVGWVHDLGSGNTVVQARSVSSAGLVGPIQNISGASLAHAGVSIAIDDNGDAVIAWRHGSADIEAATRQGPNGAFTVSVPPLDTAATGDPLTAIDNSGNAIVAWPSSGSPVGIHFASHAGATWQPGSIANGAHQLLDPSLAANANGDAVIAFHDMTLDVVAAVSGTVAGGFPSGPTDIKTLSSAPISHGPGAAIDNSGTALVGWTTANNVQYSVKPAGGAFPAPGIVGTITPVPVSPANFVLRGDGRGDVIATWYAFEGGHNAMRAAVKSGSSAGFGASQIISDPSKDTNDARIAFDKNGDAVVGLAQFNGAPTGVAAAVYDASAPLIGAVTRPTSLKSGQTGSFSSQALDGFSTATLTWSFGDGSATAAGTAVSHKYARSGRFTVTLTATDAAANSASTTFTVTVASALPPPPPPPKCVVPKLAGKTLSQARTALSRAHCKLGKVHQPKKPKHRRLRKLIVKSSSPGRGAVRANGTKVAVTLVEVPKPKPKKHKK